MKKAHGFVLVGVIVLLMLISVLLISEIEEVVALQHLFNQQQAEAQEQVNTVMPRRISSL